MRYLKILLTAPEIEDDCVISRCYLFTDKMKLNILTKFLLSFFCFFIVSCNNQNKPIQQQQQKKRIVFSEKNKNLSVFENYARKIDGNKSLEKIQSLFYSDTAGNTSESFAWIDEENDIVKLQQNVDLVTGRKIERIFYFLNGLKTMSRQIVYYYDREKPIFSEEISYYSLKNSVIASFTRFSKTEELDLATFKESQKHFLPHQTALAIVKRTGDFETRFRGFEKAFDRKFIVLGTANQTTTVAFNVESPILSELIKMEKSRINTLLDVSFTPITEPNGFTFQALIELEYAKKRD